MCAASARPSKDTRLDDPSFVDPGRIDPRRLAEGEEARRPLLADSLEFLDDDPGGVSASRQTYYAPQRMTSRNTPASSRLLRPLALPVAALAITTRAASSSHSSTHSLRTPPISSRCERRHSLPVGGHPDQGVIISGGGSIDAVAHLNHLSIGLSPAGKGACQNKKEQQE